MGIDLYYSPTSYGCRAVLIAAKYLDIKLNLIRVDLFYSKDHLEPEFTAINPQQCVPTLNDDGFILWDSPSGNAILEYLAEKYGNGKLYPNDLNTQIRITQRLNFDLGVLYARFADFYFPQWFKNEPPLKRKHAKLADALDTLNTILEKSYWVASEKETIADITIGVNVATIEYAGFDLTPYKHILNWFHRFKKLPGAELDKKGIYDLKKLRKRFYIYYVENQKHLTLNDESK